MRSRGMHTFKYGCAIVLRSLRLLRKKIDGLCVDRIYFGRSLARVPAGAIVFFPCRPTFLACGLAGIVAFKQKKKAAQPVDLEEMTRAVMMVARHRLADCLGRPGDPAEGYLGGDALSRLLAAARRLKHSENFCAVYADVGKQAAIKDISRRLSEIIGEDSRLLAEKMGHLDTRIVDVLTRRLEELKDVSWSLTTEILQNVAQITDLLGADGRRDGLPPGQLMVYKNINTVLNSIDRLEVRGRDSAGISLMFILEDSAYRAFGAAVDRENLLEELQERSARALLVNGGITVHELKGAAERPQVTVTLTYKVAAEIGRLGDNIRFLRQQIKKDRIFHLLMACPHVNHTVSSHTRWASVGAITEANCHPVDNHVLSGSSTDGGIIHVCLNGDIDNYLALKAEHLNGGKQLHKDITTDTKIIPLQVEKYIQQGCVPEEAFRRAVNDFEGSHAISMHTDLAPGKFFLAQKGSGQTVFIGLSEDLYMPTSEVYGFVEETADFLKMDGAKIVSGKNGDTQGQIFILDQESTGGLAGIRAMYYDGTPIVLKEADIKHTEITSRDIDRQNFPHYFLKEISESPNSVERTLQNRWKIREENGRKRHVVNLDAVVPEKLRRSLAGDSVVPGIRRIYFVGQGTAGVAAQACADILNYYLNNPALQVRALKASELSGFTLSEKDAASSMADALVIAISQSGTTTDTNRTVAMVRERGAHTLAIVNRRDSDITFKVDGVMYTSSGRDIEMSVASTKAFYSQIVAGALLGLYIAGLKNRRNADFVSAEIQRLLDIPAHMRTVLASYERIGASAKRLATQKAHWAVVGSGPNKASADEIRIKLSELCYKTISTDFVEDKKHIDLSAEPLIIVCAAGTRDAVLGDIIKDTAIFKAHKATPVVIATEGETRFEQYADDVFHVPAVSEHLAPILNTLVGHIWGYYAALSFNEGSLFMYNFQTDLQKTLDEYTTGGLDLYEILLEKTFREKIVTFYNDFRRKKSLNHFPAAMGLQAAANITLLLKYLAGKLPVSDFEIDFGTKGTPSQMLNHLFRGLGECINAMARPVDAIKHQAKTVTVGTSRLSEKLEGLLFDTLADYDFKVSQLTTGNIIVLRNLQGIIADIKGAIRYRIGNLNLLGEPTDDTTIHVERKDGVLSPIPSRVETDTQLKGTKRIIVRQGNVYIGKGRKDDRSILVIPIISTNPSTPNFIEHLLLLNIGFEQNVPLAMKIKALGGKYEHITSIVQENSVPWKDEYLELVAMDELFGRSAEKIGEYIVAQVSTRAAVGA
jgi:glucosamine--fructose-6-phosphate aminotransferase (isomerizing)